MQDIISTEYKRKPDPDSDFKPESVAGGWLNDVEIKPSSRLRHITSKVVRSVKASVEGDEDIGELHWEYPRDAFADSLLGTAKVYLSIATASAFALSPIPFLLAAFLLHRWLGAALCVAVCSVYLSSYVWYTPQRFSEPPCFPILKFNPVYAYAKFYFNWRLIRRVAVGGYKSPADVSIIAVQPHAILAINRITMMDPIFEDEVFPQRIGHFAAATPQFYTPGIREICIGAGAKLASKKILVHLLAAARSVYIWVGGTRELMLTDPNSHSTELVISDRKGFVKLAIENGVAIVPTMQFGEKWVYCKWTASGWLRSLLYTLKIPSVLFYGHCFTSIPFRQRADGSPITMGMVFDTAIAVKQMKPVPPQYLDQIHGEYMRRMQLLFDRYKSTFGYTEDETLRMVSAKSVQM